MIESRIDVGSRDAGDEIGKLMMTNGKKEASRRPLAARNYDTVLSAEPANGADTIDKLQAGAQCHSAVKSATQGAQ